MKIRIISIIVAIVGVLTFVVSRFVLMEDVPVDDFKIFVRNSWSQDVIAYQGGAAVSPMLLLVSLRFPENKGQARLGFPDRTDVYTMMSSSERFRCYVHIRRNRVCRVTFEDSAQSVELREKLVSEFPRLSVE